MKDCSEAGHSTVAAESSEAESIQHMQLEEEGFLRCIFLEC